MKIIKNYEVEEINLLRNNLIELFGSLRDFFLIVEDNIKNNKKISIDDINKSNINIETKYKFIEDRVIEIIDETKLNDPEIRMVLGCERIIFGFSKISNKIYKLSHLYNNLTDFNNRIILNYIDLLNIMIDKLFIGFSYREIENCYEVINEDKPKLYKLKTDKLIELEKNALNNKNCVKYIYDSVKVLSYLERIGDYFVFTAEEIIYILTGNAIRYTESA